VQEDVLWKAANDNAKDIVLKLLERDPTKRLTAREALDHPWLKGDLLQSRQVASGVANMLPSKAIRFRREAKQAQISGLVHLMSPVRCRINLSENSQDTTLQWIEKGLIREDRQQFNRSPGRTVLPGHFHLYSARRESARAHSRHSLWLALVSQRSSVLYSIFSLVRAAWWLGNLLRMSNRMPQIITSDS
jgi:serine/threonine protein kinase